MEILFNFMKEKLLIFLMGPDGIRNFFGPDEKTQYLKRKIEELSSREADVNTELRGLDFQSGKKRKRETVQYWLRSVERKKKEFQSIQQAAGDRRFYRLSRVQLGKRVEEMIGEVADLIQQGNFPEGLTLDVHETIGKSLLTTGLFGQTFHKNFDNIWKCLKNDEILSIGIHGMGGVGKTATMKHIHNLILENPDTFGNVYWVTVSQNFSIDRLQNDIAREAGLTLSSADSEMRRAADLSRALTRRNKSILILDDVWNHIPPERVGIPIGVNGFKLILTTRMWDVCRRVGCQSYIKVAPLSEEEAWNLFIEKLGHDTLLSPEMEEIAKCVTKRCAGLPLGIITMAASMKGVDDIHEWRNVLEELKTPTTGQCDFESEVVPVLRSSYSRLGNEKLQRCFLYCALFPEDSEIERENLIKSFIFEGLLDRSKSRQAEFDMGHTVLNKLENCCLLESSNCFRKHRFVKMHDLIRDMALQITRAGQPFMVQAAVQLREIPDEEEWTEDLVKVSLMKNKISKIPPGISPRCPRLSTLMMQGNPLRWISDSFFVHMHGLQVLDLSLTFIEELPNSISDLENLTALLVRGCRRLTYVPPLGKLKALRDLDLGWTGIKKVPHGMEALFNLKCLYMDDTKYLEMLPTGILPKLSHLQQVTLEGSSEHVKVRSEELEGLKQLEEFEGRLYDLTDFNRFVKSQCYERLRVCHLQVQVGYGLNFGDEHACVKVVRLGNCSLGDGLLLPRDIQYLDIDKCHDMSSCLLDVSPSLNSARDLKNILVSRCDEIECILKLSSSDEIECVQLQSLETLGLYELKNFNALFKWEGVISLPFGTFSSLKFLSISFCPKIKKLFTARSLLPLQLLEVMRLRGCNQMEEIIADEEGIDSSSSITLSKLRDLDLCELPQLKSIFRGTMICDSIEEISLVRCRKLKRFPLFIHALDGQPSPPRVLKKIKIHIEDKQWWESLELDYVNAKSVLQPFIQFIYSKS